MMGTNKLDWDKLFSMQQELDRRIEEGHGLVDENLIDRKILALQVELAELANETRCFKFWSLKPPAPKDVILEEYVDGIHFLLSLGIEIGYTGPIEAQGACGHGMVEQFNALFEMISGLRNNQTTDEYVKVFGCFLTLGEELGFTMEDIQHAYMKKNEVNHERQETGY